MSWLSTLWDAAKGAISGAWKGITGNIGQAVGPLVGAGAQYVLGNDQREDQARQAAEQQAANLAAQREFAQNGLRWKIADAHAAGVHPLFALGGAGAAFAPNPISIAAGPDTAAMGQNISRAASALTSTHERQLRDLQLRAATAAVEKDEAQAAFIRSQMVRNLQASTPGVASGVLDSELQPGDLVQPSGAIVRPLVTSSAPAITSRWDTSDLTGGKEPAVGSVAPGEAPFWKTFVWAPGQKIDLPNAADSASAVESIAESNAILAWVLVHNYRKYGYDPTAMLQQLVPQLSLDSKLWDFAKSIPSRVKRFSADTLNRVPGYRVQ